MSDNEIFENGFTDKPKQDSTPTGKFSFSSEEIIQDAPAPKAEKPVEPTFTAEPVQESAPIQPTFTAEPAQEPAPTFTAQPVQEPAPTFTAASVQEPVSNQQNLYTNYGYDQNAAQPTYNQAPAQPPRPVQTNYSEAPQQPIKPAYTDTNEIMGDGASNSKKSKKGLYAVAALLGFCIVIGLAAMLIGLTSSSETESTTNSVESILTETTEATTVATDPTIGTTTEIETTQTSSTELTAVEVAALVRQSVVGVLCYDSSGSLSEEGSGVIISEQNGYTYVITCAHVISDSPASLGILMLDGTTYEAQIVGYDEVTDIGVVRIEATGLPIIEIGDSSSLQIGETVYAIGNPGGSDFFGSITDGIVSSIDRSLSSTYSITLIQHNAAINPGNSGGALVNSAGQLVGINSSKIADTDYEGMGFAVPTSIAISIAENLITYGYVPDRPKLGIEYASISSYQLYSMVAAIAGLPSESLVIAGISSDSSLADTNAQVGDIIIAVNGESMTDASILLDLIENGSVGDEIVLTLCRIDNTYQTSTFDVTVYLVEDVPEVETTTEATTSGSYNYGGSNSFDDFLQDYFGF